ncbi:gloverin-like [Battus philenor]|uniref:gloverin-like n=1 Tax=Battus philenor TaxID=42288 RepID=UPI0035CECD76
MKVLCILLGIVAVAVAQYDYQVHPLVLIDSYPEWYIGSQSGLAQQRHRRDVTFDHKTNNGRVFGTLGQNDAGLFGKGGYEHKFFDDHRGRLDGQAYGTRVLGPNGDSSHLGGALNWKDSNAAASFDISKQIHGPTSMSAGAGGIWPVGKNGDFSLQGTYGKTSGMNSEFGGKALFNYRW